MISCPNLNKPRVEQLRIGGRTVQSGYMRPVIMYRCYGYVMLFKPGRPRINEVSCIGGSIQEAYENFMRIYGLYFPEQGDSRPPATEPDPHGRGRAGPEAQASQPVDNEVRIDRGSGYLFCM